MMPFLWHSPVSSSIGTWTVTNFTSSTQQRAHTQIVQRPSRFDKFELCCSWRTLRLNSCKQWTIDCINNNKFLILRNKQKNISPIVLLNANIINFVWKFSNSSFSICSFAAFVPIKFMQILRVEAKVKNVQRNAYWDIYLFNIEILC